MRIRISLSGAKGNDLCVGRQQDSINRQPDQVDRMCGERPDRRQGSIQGVAAGTHGNYALGR